MGANESREGKGPKKSPVSEISFRWGPGVDLQ